MDGMSLWNSCTARGHVRRHDFRALVVESKLGLDQTIDQPEVPKYGSLETMPTFVKEHRIYLGFETIIQKKIWKIWKMR